MTTHGDTDMAVDRLAREVVKLSRRVDEHDRLLQQALPQMQERIDHLEAVVIDRYEQVAQAMTKMAASVDRLASRLPCLAADPTIPCAGDKESE